LEFDFTGPHNPVQFIYSANTPEDALGFATQAARTFTRHIEGALSALLD
jgi:hypothetical protein